ncbi:MAG: cupredoxin domain-containing protein [Chloroflexi bacterium]|nr:cupredoxin domain-containing protein [Chloroflexota bacterium]
MKQLFKWTGLVLFAAVIGLALAVAFTAGVRAQSPVAVAQGVVAQATPYPYGYGGPWGYGMTPAPALRSGRFASAGVGQGGQGYGYGGMGPGMMGAYGYGHMGGMGGYGGWGYGYGFTPQGTPVPADQEIQLSAANFRFDPASVTVNAGKTVRLVIANKDGVPHNLYGSNLALAYTLLPSGVSQSATFTAPTTPGTYLAVCTFHPGMSLEIIVK